MSEFYSWWRCDSCGETFTVVVTVEGIARRVAPMNEIRHRRPRAIQRLDAYLRRRGVPVDRHVVTVEAIARLDPSIESVPCQICGADTRRIESPADLRDWGEALR